MVTTDSIKKELTKLSNPKKAEFFPYFFKTEEGQYGHGDKFIGVTMPNQRIVAKKYFKEVELDTLKELLQSEIHEHRMTALIMLVYKMLKEKDEETKKKYYDFYLSNTDRINNWDLVDASARDIVGGYLIDKDRSKLYELAKSNDLWEQRIAIVSTWEFIRKKDLEDTFKLSELLLDNKHDLIHKAVGWMLREAGKKDVSKLTAFLDKNYKKMPRTMLRYAIEKYREKERLKYLKGLK